MNVIFLSPSATPNHHKFCVRLKEKGVNVLGLGDEPYEYLHHELKSALTEFYKVDNLHNYHDLVRALGYLTFKYGKIDRIDSLNEYWLETEAKLRTDFNIPGIKLDTIYNIKRKSLMKKIYEGAGLPVAPGALVHSLNDARALIHKTGYPVVAKPDIGVGALSTYKIHNEEELTNFFSTKPAEEYIMEAFINGTICSFDGLADREGTPVFYTSHEYSRGVMETVNDALDMYYFSHREIPPLLEATGLKTLGAFNVRERFFHFEFFRTDTGYYVPLEVNIRPPGGYTTDMFNYAADFDVYDIWAELLVKGSVKVEYQRKYHCCYVSRKANISYKHAHDVIIKKYGDVVLARVSVPGVFSTALGNEGYLLRTKEQNEMIKIAEYIHQRQ
ncbi:MAG: ATP-grasp domain-containing protein [Deltaproteobacteria bacterium]|nr:ATP-grasp domain-containing protein [Deltaproteobacteria bacterium]